MKSLINFLDGLDTYFKSKKDSEKWLILFSIAGILLYISYASLVPYAQDLERDSSNTLQKLEKRIQKNTIYLRSITIDGNREYYIEENKIKIQNSKNRIKAYNKKIEDIDKSIFKLSKLLFNEKSWAIFLKSITGIAKNNNIFIQRINNNYVDSNGSFGHVLEIEIISSGKFKDVLKFINTLENNVLVTDLYSSVISGNKNRVQADLNISVWGINNK